MAKTILTLEIENALQKRISGTPERYGKEIQMSNGKQSGIVDFVGVDFRTNYSQFAKVPKIICYEIKVSYSDFLSENGHTLIGDENYYVMPLELHEEILRKDPRLINKYNTSVGVIVYDEGKLRIRLRSGSKLYQRILTIEQRFKILDEILKKWCNGNMYENVL